MRKGFRHGRSAEAMTCRHARRLTSGAIRIARQNLRITYRTPIPAEGAIGLHERSEMSAAYAAESNLGFLGSGRSLRHRRSPLEQILGIHEGPLEGHHAVKMTDGGALESRHCGCEAADVWSGSQVAHETRRCALAEVQKASSFACTTAAPSVAAIRPFVRHPINGG